MPAYPKFPSERPEDLPATVPAPIPFGVIDPASQAYYERNRVLAAFVRIAMGKGYRAWLGLHEQTAGDLAWSPEWRYVVYLELPTGQVSWHIHERDRPMFGYLRLEKRFWDGHSTDEKYGRLAAYVARFAEFEPQPAPASAWWRRWFV
jgi:hypothetical protein